MNIPARKINPSTIRQVGLALTVFYLLLAAIYIASVPARLNAWFSLPFLGTFIEPGMTVAAHGSLVSQAWKEAAGSPPNNSQLVALNGKAITNTQDLSRFLTQKTPGDEVNVFLLTPLGDPWEFRLPLSQYTLSDRLIYYLIPYLLSLLFLGCAGWVLISGWKIRGSFNLVMSNAAVAVGVAGFFDVYSTHQQLAFWVASLAIAGGALLHTSLNYPDHIHLPQHWRWLRFSGYLATAAVVIGVLVKLTGARAGIDFLYTLRIATVYAVICLSAALVILILRRISSISPYERDLSTMFFASLLLSFMPVVLWWIADFTITHITFSPLLFIPAAVYPLVSGYTVQHARSLDTDYRVLRVTIYALIALAGGIGYALLAGGIGLVWSGLSPIQSALVNGIIIFLLALFLHPLRRAALARVEPLIFHSEQAFQDRILTFSRELTRLDTVPAILDIFQAYIVDAVHPQRVQFFLYEQKEKNYRSPQSDLVFEADSPLVRTLRTRQEPLFISSFDDLPADLRPDSGRIALLGVSVFLPLPGKETLAGWLGLSRKVSGEAYSSREIAYLESLCDRAALTVERTMTSQELQLRVRELDALVNLSRAASLSHTPEDLAETIYHQTISVFPAQDFRLILTDRQNNSYSDIYRVEAGQRLLRDTESVFLPDRPSLEMDILRTGEALLCDDYTRECLKRGVVASAYGIYSWMGVPLRIDDQITGGLFIGSRDPTTALTIQQLNLLQAFANQLAGSIQKTSLLSETRRQTDQLAALNDLSSQIVSSLDLDAVLESTLARAVSLMGGEAGSLLLVDEEHAELVFRTVTGPVAGKLLGKRIPLTAGLAGTAIERRKPVVVRDVLTAPEWLPQVDQDTGFSTRALVAEPLIVKGKPVGVIEIINGEDGVSFSQDDLYMLASFAAQASLAIENARLYSSLAGAYEHESRARSEFISTIAHELKNPMTSIRGYSELLAGGAAGPLNPEQLAFVDTIHTNLERMNRLVTLLNDVSKVESGRVILEISSVSPAEILQAAVKSLGSLPTKMGITIDLPANLDSLPEILGDRPRLVQAVTEVLHNAVVYSPEGSCVRVTAICEGSGPGQPDILLSVCDSGLGISPEDEAHLFEKHFRSQDPAIRAVPGIGLGLHLAKSLLEMQSGNIWFERPSGPGAIFHIKLPIQR